MSQIQNIFNANIAQEINKEMGSLLLPVNLSKKTALRNSNDATLNDIIGVDYYGRGFTSMEQVRNKDGTLVASSNRIVSILGASLPSGICPEPGDEVIIENIVGTIVDGGVSRDPAGALFQCIVN